MRRAAERELRETSQRLAELEGMELRRDVAARKGLTPAQAKRLVGDTEEELLQDADEIVALFGPKGPNVPSHADRAG